MLLSGLDGCKRNCWVVARSDDDVRAIRFGIEANLSRIFDEAQSGRAVVVLDVPIGLSNGVRDCDVIARRLLKPRRHNSVFRAPCRDAVASGLDYRRALEINRQRSGVGISKQAYCIGDRIRSVDELMTPALQEHVREGHPEMTLTVLDADQPQEHHKRTSQGIADRLDVLLRSAVPAFDPRQERLRLGGRNWRSTISSTRRPCSPRPDELRTGWGARFPILPERTNGDFRWRSGPSKPLNS